MKIKEIKDEGIIFDNGNYIWTWYYDDCGATNYADFQQLEDLAFEYDFETEIIFEKVPGAGFRFGDKRMMFFVPCYSEQNGYYSSEINVGYFTGRVAEFFRYGRSYMLDEPDKILRVECELVDD